MVTTFSRPKTSKKTWPGAAKAPLWARFLRGVAYAGVLLLALEGAFALGGIGEQEYLKPDPAIGYAGIPHKHVTWRQEGFGRNTFNSLGMQDREHVVPKPAGTTRVAVFGDSFVEALQVDRDKNFCSLVESQLNASGQGSFEVLNFGASAYDLGQMYLRFKHQALAFHPDVVVVALRQNGVFALVPTPEGGGMLSAKPTFFLNKGKLELTNIMQEKFGRSSDGKRLALTEWFREHSRIWGVVSLLVQDLRTQLPNAFPRINSAAVAEAAPSGAPQLTRRQRDSNQLKATAFYWPLAEAILSSMKADCDKAGIKMILLRMPATALSNNNDETKLIESYARAHGIPFIGTDQDFSNNASLFYSNHFSPAGHKVMANKLESYIRSTIGIPSSVNP